MTGEKKYPINLLTKYVNGFIIGSSHGKGWEGYQDTATGMEDLLWQKWIMDY